MASIMPPPETAVARRNERRSISVGAMASSLPLRRDDVRRDLVCRVRRIVRGAMNGFANTGVGRAATEIAAHGEIDIGVGRARVSSKQRRRGHDLPCLAVAALRYVQLLPRALKRM